jgi:hypothetical protein
MTAMVRPSAESRRLPSTRRPGRPYPGAKIRYHDIEFGVRVETFTAPLRPGTWSTLVAGRDRMPGP